MASRILPSALVAAALAFAGPASAQTEIQWWHAMSGALGEKLEKIASDFNASQGEYKIVPVYKGSYPETMTGAIAAFRAKQHPAVVQVFEVGTATLMAAKGAVYPVYKLMADANEPFDPKVYLPSVTGYYSDTAGNMLSLPFNSSTAILYYNKDLFTKAGLDPNVPPKTWPEVEADARKLQAAGVPCGFTTQWPSWVNVENLSAWHNIPIGTKQNGMGGLDTVLEIANPLVEKHWTALAEWQKSKIYDYGGRQSKADPKFFSGECAISIGSSAARAAILANAKFDLGYGMMPYWPDVKGAPQNSIIGGASLWVLNGRPKEEYRGVAKFFTYLSRADVQAWWHQQTGYLPITQAAYDLSKSQGFYEKNPGTDISILQMTLNPPTENSKGLRFGSFVQIRDVIEEELEATLAGKKTPKEALAAAQSRGNEMLRAFEKANQ
ncbi:MAG: sn-glycerol-3-phosphate ABC transporter substrate-binding protein [Rhizobiales bacterium 24-66-13]|jgi:sn-glycerol 3-phosphate transport system substrate-binding protein|nr:MAG: sn-glycerol-3-phosphate ABC transporter substrate-binding protein [Rhizobiales bacterium 24-66-13]OZB04314.1 MAG: sn-glycerol-3-phosphate ABC transporter substrate-binding protein [Rhizobiales bacterium 39-66-18]HQS07576.1 sn-glycerol-3-phosphate ABC transporter substrate-binding protein UgpB [Xanthobacteraceae bacterium]HQS49827.1 sn-glycerol-3-phosphate ABC transporter substrate-binding protein UgpB [Xanthobacteraceae bacterium]